MEQANGPIAVLSPEVASVVIRAAEVVERTARIFERSRVIVTESRNLRSHCPSGIRFFVVHGVLDEFPVRANWFQGALTATSPLLARSRMLVDLGEEFVDDRGASMAADLDEALPALLTVLRACDLVRSVQLGPLGERTGCGPRLRSEGGSG